ncbi:unnamed protein product [Parascedosporium putredinis]|uniref:Ankyrin n=1 Tax=Parascedosporium putredinis TaxID=1442378 RepID=A0A9P1H2L7_9PEZI|nr:unnamed protein product [Parascedosporium putredinis]CAI7995086.1 unnamed protein product [Parascedosporium putredinis]
MLVRISLPGVVEALIARLTLTGVSLDLPPPSKNKGLLQSRRKSFEGGFDDRAEILKEAVRSCSIDVVNVLVPHADPSSLNASVALALQLRKADVIDILLRYGARVCDSTIAQDEFRKLSMAGGHSEIIALVLRSEGKPSQLCLSQAMVDAARVSCLDTVLVLSRSSADANFNDAEALRIARPGLDEAVTVLFTLTNLSLNEKLAILELLLCAGAAGEAVDIGLIHAASAGSRELVGLLVKYGAALTFQDAIVGANGASLHNALVDSVEAGDIESARLLLTPQFTTNRTSSSSSHDVPFALNSMGLMHDRHEVASVDHKGGLALSIAVSQGDIPMTKLLLSAKPSLETLAQVFPTACAQPAEDARYALVEAFLLVGLRGNPLDVALQEAISKSPVERDERLIAILLSHNASVNFGNGAGLSNAIQQGDIGLIRTLVGSASPSTAANVVTSAMKIEDVDARREAMGLLLDAGAANEGRKNLSSAVVATLSSKPVDVRMLRLLLDQANADVGFENGAAIKLAIDDPDPTILKLLLKLSKPSKELIRTHLANLMNLPSTDSKTTKLRAFLPSLSQDELNEALVLETAAALKTDPDHLTLSSLATLISTKADVDSLNARALSSLPHTIHNKDPKSRLDFAKRLIRAGAPKLEATRALAYCIEVHTDDIPLLTLLAEHGDISDGIALMKAIRKESPTVVALLLEKADRPISALDKSFEQAMKIADQPTRLEIAQLLLKSEISDSVISAGLLTAVSDVDFSLGKLLISAGASLADCDSRGIVNASRSGSPEMLAMLLSGLPEPKRSSSRKRFKQQRKGVSGDVVDEQLISAARYGESGHDMLRVLLAAGATPNYDNGESVCVAIRSAILPNLELLLGRELTRMSQERPNAGTLSEALKASWTLSRERRLVVIQWLFEAGLQVTSELHSTLEEMVKEEEQDLVLIDLLLDRGASPLHNDCQSIIDATSHTSAPVLSRLLGRHGPSDCLDHILSSAFKKEEAARWFTSQGLTVLQMILKACPGKRIDGCTLSIILELAPSQPNDLADAFVTSLAEHGVDVNYQQAKPLRLTAAAGRLTWLQALLEGERNSTATPDSLAIALFHVFDMERDEEEAVALITAILEHERDSARIDVMYPHSIHSPILALALERYPRSVRILELLLDEGYYHDQMVLCSVLPDVEEEPVTLLTWALLQPQKRVSTAIIDILISRGAKVNFESKLTRISPVMLAIRARRPDVVEKLLHHGAEVDGITDATGFSPLAMAVSLGGDVSIQIMTNFPSPLHGGRTALAEVCRHAASDSSQPLDSHRERALERMLSYLIENGSDLAIKSDGKSALFLSFESSEPVLTTRALLKSGMWKHVNQAFNMYSNSTHTYSPTIYVRRMILSHHSEQLYWLLRANRCEDVFYAHEGPQPEGAVGLPDDILREERGRRARLARLAAEHEDHAIALSRARALGELQAQIYRAQADLEALTRKGRLHEELSATRERDELERDLAAVGARNRAEERSVELAHQKSLTEEMLSRVRAVSNLELEEEGKKAAVLFDWEEKMGIQRVENARALHAIRVAESQDLARQGSRRVA